MSQDDSLRLSADALAARLAQLEEQVENGSAPLADATVAHLKAELDTFAATLRRQQPSQFDRHSACVRVTAMVQAMGRQPREVNDLTIDLGAGTSSRPADVEAVPLATLGMYELLAKLGAGGMGAVYKARHTRLDKIVALKLLPAERMQDPEAVARFEREMRAVGKLEHPNIVRAMDAGEANGTHFLVMEYVQGVDLSQLVRQCAPLAIADACELVRQAAVGLEEAREHGMVHRDIKPSNLMLCSVSRKKPPVVKVLDMGLALLSEAYSPDAQGLTNTGQMMGTLDYMAPEQGGDSHDVDIRADIYALGASLYKLLCGEVIYHGAKYQTPVQKMMALATQSAPPIQQRRQGVPNELAAVLHRMLEKNPAHRFARPEEVAHALTPFCAGANLAALLSQFGFPPAPVRDASLSATEPSVMHPGADTSVSKTPSPPGPPASAAGAKPAQPPVAPSGKSSPALARPPAANASPPKTPLSAPGGDPPVALPAGTTAAPRPRRPTAATKGKSAGRGKLPPWLPVAVGGGLLSVGGTVALLGAMVVYFQAPNGTLRVEINDPSIEVVVQGTDIVLKQADQKDVLLTPGPHALTIKRGDFRFDTSRFELKKGKTTTVQVDLLPGKVQVVSAGQVLGQGTIVDATEGLIGYWPLDGDLQSANASQLLVGTPRGKPKFVDTPFGQGISLDGLSWIDCSEREALNVGEGEFTLAAWIRPRRQQGMGILCLGGHEYRHGWLIDLPSDQGIFRLETSNARNAPNGTVQSKPGTIQNDKWQHVAAVVRRGENATRLYVNGTLVAEGTVQDADLDNPQARLQIGRIEGAPPIFIGEIDEVRIYRRALGETEIATLARPPRHARLGRAPVPDRALELPPAGGENRALQFHMSAAGQPNVNRSQPG